MDPVDDECWARARATTETDEAREDIGREAQLIEGALKDGLEPQDWSTPWTELSGQRRRAM
jgi:hypothetical protein